MGPARPACRPGAIIPLIKQNNLRGRGESPPTPEAHSVPPEQNVPLKDGVEPGQTWIFCDDGAVRSPVCPPSIHPSNIHSFIRSL